VANGWRQIDLSREDARTLGDLLLDATDPPGRRPRGPIGTWIGTADAARLANVTASTIRSWITRDGPSSNPFPHPDQRYAGRSYWQKKTVDRWRARQKRLDDQRKKSRKS
jgi:hypothetical protein